MRRSHPLVRWAYLFADRGYPLQVSAPAVIGRALLVTPVQAVFAGVLIAAVVVIASPILLVWNAVDIVVAEPLRKRHATRLERRIARETVILHARQSHHRT